MAQTELQNPGLTDCQQVMTPGRGAGTSHGWHNSTLRAHKKEFRSQVSESWIQRLKVFIFSLHSYIWKHLLPSSRAQKCRRSSTEKNRKSRMLPMDPNLCDASTCRVHFGDSEAGWCQARIRYKMNGEEINSNPSFVHISDQTINYGATQDEERFLFDSLIPPQKKKTAAGRDCAKFNSISTFRLMTKQGNSVICIL